MTILERFENLREKDKENVDAFLELFDEDSRGKSVLIGHFYSFFQYVFSVEGFKRLKIINQIAKRYYNNNPYFENIYQLIYIQMNYSYSVGDYTQVISFINKFDKANTPSEFLVGAYCNQLNILTLFGLEEEAYECIKEIVDADFFVNCDSYSKGVFYLNAVPLAVKTKDVSKTYEYLELLEESLNKCDFRNDEKGLLIKIINFYARIFLTKYELIEGNVQLLAIEFYNYIMNNNIFTKTITFDTNTFITILENIIDYCSDKMLYDICEKIISDTNPVNRDLIDFYEFLYKTSNVFYLNNAQMKNKHLNCLHSFYNELNHNNVHNLRDTLRLQLLEQKYSELESKYNMDVLTNCYNRNYLLELESNSISSGCVCYLDLDNLKQINDAYGHSCGDIYLKAFSKILHDSFEDVHNQIFRYGGDEFVIVVYNEDKETISKCLERMCNTLNTTIIKKIKVSSISFSCGVCFIDKEMFLKKAIALADKSMYVCKNIRKTNPECKYIINND